MKLAVIAGKNLRIYFEGDVSLKPGFRAFLKGIDDHVRQNRWKLDLIATEGTPAQDYRTGLSSNPNAWNVLLLDSDEPFTQDLLRKKGLSGLDRESIFWMVQVMESWFIADREALARYYGQNFNIKAIPKNAKIEAVSKKRVLDGLKRATKNTQKKEYDKTGHAPEILAKINPTVVRNASPHCERLFEKILARANPTAPA